MRKIVGGIFVCMLLLLSAFPFTVKAGDAKNPDVVDRIMDVKLFGVIGFPFQANLKYADIVSSWFFENNTNPNFLYVSLKLRDLEDKTDGLEAIYDVDWSFNNNYYITCVHANPYGFGVFSVGRSTDGDDVFEEWEICDGMFDTDSNVITWEVSKDTIGNPQPFSKLINIFPSTHLRFTDNSGLPLMDLFKDLSWNAKTTKDYVIQY